MIKKLMFVAGAGVGYVLGTRAGREKYNELVSKARKVADRPEVQEMTQAVKSAVAPEILFIERCVQWLKPGGRMGIVLPDGVLGNPGDEYIRYWILRHCWVLACRRRLNFDPPCRSNIDPGTGAAFAASGCG